MMKKLFIIGISCLLLVGCSNTKEEDKKDKEANGYRTITAKEAYELIDEDAVVLDVRTEGEYNDTHIKDAINVPLDEISETINDDVYELKSKDVKIFVYCASGNRSKKAASKLASLGYINVFDFGGINDWNYGVVDGKIEEAENTINGIIKSIELQYTESIINDEPFALPLSVTCNGKTCTYNGKHLPVSAKNLPVGTIVLKTDGKIEDNFNIQVNDYQCSIKSEIVTCK